MADELKPCSFCGGEANLMSDYSSDRRAMVEGLDVIRVACVQPVGTSASERVKGAVSSAEYERAKMMVVMGAMQLWASGKLDEVEVDDG